MLDPIVGRVLGDFLVKEKLGEGGFGAVYKAQQITLVREAVIKVLHTKHSTNLDIIERFKREAYLASRLEHPYCAHIYSFGAENDGLLWIAMEKVVGTPLNELIKIQGPLPLERLVPLLDKICEVVHTAHESGIVHRDLKPANVMVISRAGQLLPKLLDFGIAKDLYLKNSLSENGLSEKPDNFSNAQLSNVNSESQTLRKSEVVIKKKSPEDSESGKNSTLILGKAKPENNKQPINEPFYPIETQGIMSSPIETQGIMGSPRYMSPEQWEGAVNADARSDIYALGVITYELLMGAPPFTGSIAVLMNSHLNKLVPKLGKHLPEKLNLIIAKATAKDPLERYQTALEFAKDFRETAGFVDNQITLPQLDEFLKENLLTNAPKPIADTVASLVVARNIYQFKDRILLVFRVLVRYLGILALSSYAGSANSKENNDLIIKAITNLRQQGLSELMWIEFSRELCRPFAKKRDAFPIPELVTLFFALDSEQLSSLTEIFTKLSQLQQEIISSASSKEEQLIKLLTDFLAKLSVLLDATSWLNSYYLVLPEGLEAKKWMGSLKEPNVIAIRSNNLPLNKTVLVDAQGFFVLSLWPLVEITKPTLGASLEVFLLECKGYTGAKLVSFPSGFEIETEAPWEWIKEHFLTNEEKEKTGKILEKSPYLGLITFSPADYTLFFGRERETESFLNRLRVEPLLVIVGSSGAGKSSFIQAGVVARLAQNWKVITMRPGFSPIATLSTKLLKLGIDLPDLKFELQKDINYLAKSLKEFAIKQNEKILLVIDQFEEILTLCLDKEEQNLYVEALTLAACLEEDPIRVVLTVRDDFLIRAKELKGLKDRLSQALEILTTPDSTQLLRILTEPAHRAGYEFEDQQLPVEIINSVAGQTSALPLLAFTAVKLWEQRDKEFKQIRRRSYEAMGGVGGALARHAENIMQQMSQLEQSFVRDIFHHLVTSEGTRASLARPEIFQLLGKATESEAVIEKLISARLLVATEGEKGVDRIEIIHEALLSTWPRLVKWRQEMQEGARLRDQLRSAARQWEERNRSRGLLWRDEALTEYQLWRTHYQGNLTELEEEFAQISLLESSRSQRLKRNLVAAAMIVMLLGLAIMFYQRWQTQEQLLQTLKLYEEQGRQQMLAGNLDGAAVYLSEAYSKGANSLALKYMLSLALTKAENHPPISLNNHTGMVMMANFSPNDQMIVTASADKTARIWQTIDGKELFLLKGHENTVISAQFSPDGKEILTSSLDKTAKLWKVSDGSLIATLAGHTDGLTSAIFSPDGKFVITASYDKTAKIWDSNTGKLINTLEGHLGTIYSVCFSLDGKLIATASADKTARIWDSATASLKMTLSDHQAGVGNVVFSPDNKLLLTASADKTAKLWQVADGKILYTLTGHQASITDAAFSPDGKQLLTTSRDRNAILWDSQTGSLKYILSGHKDNIGTGKFSPDGKLIVTTSYDGSARIWERATGKFLVSLSNHTSQLSSGSFSSNGEKVITSSADKTVKIWNVVPEKRLPNEISVIVNEKVPGYLQEGVLISKLQPANNQEVRIEKQNTKIDHKLDNNTFVENLSNNVKIEMVRIQGGTFEMGSPLNEKGHVGDEILHKVTVSPFYIGKYEITQSQWKEVANLPVINRFITTTPSAFEGDDLPVERVSWEDVVEFCARLSKLTGETYRLPTEAEWEYAARAGSTEIYPGNLDDMGWYEKNSGGKTHPVGEKKPNAWGLYDMQGNVWEWCMDWYGDYSTKPEIDPKGAALGNARVFRGGCWYGPAVFCRPALRFYFPPSDGNNDLGFRLVKEIK